MTEDTQQLGKYRILEELGRGGFATVYRAHDTVLKRDVALKILHPALLADPDFVTRFENDARAAAQLDYPHIVTVHDLGQLEGRLYIAMQLLPGGTLAERIKREGPLPFAEAVQVVRQVAGALDYAHGQGFVHRDVKPTNVLFNARNEAVVADFGLVKAAESSIVARSTGGGIVGTAAYIAPEVWEEKGAGPGTDVYALGCVLFEMLTGEPMFQGDTSPGVMMAHFQPHEYPAQWPEGVPPEVKGLLERALAQDPADRYPSAGAFAADLQTLSARAADPLAEPYKSLVTALAGEDWERALQLAQEIATQDPDYRDVSALRQQAAEGQARAEQAQWAAQWREQALAAEQAGQLDAACMAAQRWLEMAPGDGEAQALLERIEDARLCAAVEPLAPPPTLPRKTAKAVTTNLEARSSGFPRLPWGVLAVVALGLAVGLGTRLSSLTVKPTPAHTPTAPLTPTPTPVPRRPALGDTRVREADGMVMAYVPAGEFEMGSTEGHSDEEPVHTVYLDAFWLDQTEVTNAQYAAFLNVWGNQEEGGATWLDVGARDCLIEQRGGSYQSLAGYDEHPAVEVSWYGAAAYCAWAGGRLPTEAEWEYAARGPEGWVYPWGNTWQTGLANCTESVCKDGYDGTVPVGSFLEGASWVGAYDLSGNVWEWVADWHGRYPAGQQENPTGPASGVTREFRGGSFGHDTYYLRAANRGYYVPGVTYGSIGFRCVAGSPGN